MWAFKRNRTTANVNEKLSTIIMSAFRRQTKFYFTIIKARNNCETTGQTHTIAIYNQKQKKRNVFCFFIVCGSYISTMESEQRRFSYNCFRPSSIENRNLSALFVLFICGYKLYNFGGSLHLRNRACVAPF